MTDKLTRLADLLSKSTPGPWEMITGGDYWQWAYVYSASFNGRLFQMEEYCRMLEDAVLAAELRNAAPAMLRVIKAAIAAEISMTTAATLVGLERQLPPVYRDDWVDHHRELRAALAAWEGEK